MRLILNRQVKVAGVRLVAGADVTDLSKDYRASIEHQGWAVWQDVNQKTIEVSEPLTPEMQPEVKEETKPVEPVAKPVPRPQRKPKK